MLIYSSLFIISYRSFLISIHHSAVEIKTFAGRVWEWFLTLSLTRKKRFEAIHLGGNEALLIELLSRALSHICVYPFVNINALK